MDLNDFVYLLQEKLIDFANILPVEVFIFIGSLIEEIFAPIPSPFVTTVSGSVAAAKNYPITLLVVLAVIGSVGKVIGSVVIYKFADLSEDLVLTRFGKLLGLNHASVERIGGKFHKGGRDWWILMGLRALPIVPSSPVSAVCGIIKLPLKTFIISSIVGTTIRNFIFLYFGYSGVSAYTGLLSGIDSIESIVKYFGFLGAIVFIAFIIVIRRRIAKD